MDRQELGKRQSGKKQTRVHTHMQTHPRGARDYPGGHRLSFSGGNHTVGLSSPLGTGHPAGAELTKSKFRRLLPPHPAQENS